MSNYSAQVHNFADFKSGSFEQNNLMFVDI